LPIRYIALICSFATALQAADSFEAGPYLLHLGSDHVTVAWQTGRPTTGRVEYYTQPGQQSAVDSPDDALRHVVELRNLKPGTVYHYRVQSGPQATQFFRFATAPAEPKPFEFAIYGDSCTEPETHRKIAEAIAKAAPAFVIHLGDMLPQGDKGTGWTEHFVAPARELLASCPIFAICGDDDRAATASYAARFGLAADHTWQCWRYGDAEFFALNSNEPLAPDSPQGRWLGEALAASRARWKIVVIHEPIYSCGRHGSHDGDCQISRFPKRSAVRQVLQESGLLRTMGAWD